MSNKRLRLDGSTNASLASAFLTGDLKLAESAYAQHQQLSSESGGLPGSLPPGAEGGMIDSRLFHTQADHLSHSPYPNVSSFQQPFFYQQTDPSVYTSPWPPPPQRVPFYSSTVEGLDLIADETVNMPGLLIPTTAGQAPHDSATTDGLEGDYAFIARASEHDLISANPYAATMVDGTPSHVDISRSGQVLHLEDPGLQLRMQSLSVLDSLATQMIQTITRSNLQSVQSLFDAADTEEGQAYSTLKNLFEQTRKVYNRDSPLIDAIAIQMYQPAQQEVVRKANLATFMSSILGAHDVGFYHLNEYFLETFVPLGSRLLKWQGAILLELKTQAYISAILNSGGRREEMLDELFPSDLDAQILSRHPDAASLSPSEQDFVDRSRARKSYLLAEPFTIESTQELPKKYQWTDFVREFAACVTKNAESILTSATRTSLTGTSSNTSLSRTQVANTHSTVASRDRALQQNRSFPLPKRKATETHGNGAPVAVPKKSTASIATVRQPWTQAEEDALLTGLNEIGGPHWSQILAMYGRGGSVSEVLKDRNQVQLKDKARNLKLWHLKMGKEVPLALQRVTGELKKRGGARVRTASNDNQDKDNPV